MAINDIGKHSQYCTIVLQQVTHCMHTRGNKYLLITNLYFGSHGDPGGCNLLMTAEGKCLPNNIIFASANSLINDDINI